MNYKEKILKYQKEILIIFALLDAMIVDKNLYRFTYFTHVVVKNWWSCTGIVLFAVVLLSFAVSAFGLACQKKWAFILYYCQLPFRYVFLSFAFISIWFPIPKIPLNVHWSYEALVHYMSPAIIIAMILETIRLAITIIIHKNSMSTGSFGRWLFVLARRGWRTIRALRW